MRLSRDSWAVAAAGLLLICIGCGGGGGTEPPATTPPTAPPPVSTPLTSLNGVIYVRSDTVAWTADVTGTLGTSNVSVTLNSATATTAANGTWSLQTIIPTTSDALPVTASVSGYMPSWSPWRLVETGQSIAIGLYPERPVSPRAPGFIKGISFHDGSAWAVDWFNAGLTGPTITRMRNTVGANLVAFPDMLSLTQMDVATNTVTITNESAGLGTRAQLQTMVSQARSSGMAFMLMESVQPRGDAVVPFSTLFQIPVTNTAFWNAFFTAYRARVLEKAVIARDLGIEYFAVGDNQSYLSRYDVSLWRDLVRDVRALGYTGKLAYIAAMSLPNAFHELAIVPAEFPTLFDVMGFHIAAGVTAARGEVLANAQPRNRMRADLRIALDRANTLLAASGKSYFLKMAFPSVFGAASSTTLIEPSLTTSPVAATYTRDYMQQADLYQAVAEVVNERAGDNRIAGLVSWGYLWHDDYSRGGNFSNANNVAFDKTANIRDKPAEAVLKWWFQRW